MGWDAGGVTDGGDVAPGAVAGDVSAAGGDTLVATGAGGNAALSTASSEATPVDNALADDDSATGGTGAAGDAAGDTGAPGTAADGAAGGVVGVERTWLGSKPGLGVTLGRKRSRCEPMAIRGLLPDSALLPVALRSPEGSPGDFAAVSDGVEDGGALEPACGASALAVGADESDSECCARFIAS